MTEQEQWLKAMEHFGVITGRYKELINVPGVNVGFALSRMARLEQRYNAGERTDALLEALQSVE